MAVNKRFIPTNEFRGVMALNGNDLSAEKLFDAQAAVDPPLRTAKLRENKKAKSSRNLGGLKAY